VIELELFVGITYMLKLHTTRLVMFSYISFLYLEYNF